MFADDVLAERLSAQTRKFYVDFGNAVVRAGLLGEPYLELAGSAALYAGDGSPLTQAIGTFSGDDICAIDNFYRGRATSWEAVLTPFAGIEALGRLLDHGGKPMGWESALYRPFEIPLPDEESDSRIKIVEVETSGRRVWAELSRGVFFGEEPTEIGATLSRMKEFAENLRAYIAYWDGQPVATASLTVGLGVAAFGGGATLPEFRGRGLQTALLLRRLADAALEADVATMGALPGSSSHRNAERLGFRVAWSQLSLRMPS